MCASIGWTGPAHGEPEARERRRGRPRAAPGPPSCSDPASITARRTSAGGRAGRLGQPLDGDRVQGALADLAGEQRRAGSAARPRWPRAISSRSRSPALGLRAGARDRGRARSARASTPRDGERGPGGGRRRVAEELPADADAALGQPARQIRDDDGTSSGPASRKSSASSAIFRDRAEVAATSRETWASSASSMRPWCYGAGRTARPQNGRPRPGASDEVEGRRPAHSPEHHERRHQHLELHPAAGPEPHDLRRADRVPALAGRSAAATGSGSRRRSARPRCRGPGRRARWAARATGTPGPGASNSQSGAVAGLVQDAGEDPGAGRAEQPDQDVAGDPGGPPQQALDGEHQVDEEDREDRPAAAGDRGDGGSRRRSGRPRARCGSGCGGRRCGAGRPCFLVAL